jgi:asparaginyl-tRNA synthetase
MSVATYIDVGAVLKDCPLDKEVQLSCFVLEHRAQTKMIFVELGSWASLQTLQGVIPISKFQGAKTSLDKLSYGCSVQATGRFVKSPAKGQDYELSIFELTVIGECPSDFPLIRTKEGYDALYLRKHLHLQMRTMIKSSIARIRHRLDMATRVFFDDDGYVKIDTPLITQSDCEGAGEAFTVIAEGFPEFFKDGDKVTKASLTVSGQLHVEPFACAMLKSYVLGRSFRAEHSQTARHVSEFEMLEPEAAFYLLDDILIESEKYLKYVMQICLDKLLASIEVCAKFYDRPDLVETLKKTISEPFAHITYTDAMVLLEEQHTKTPFEVTPSWGIDLGSEHERYICESVFGKPTYITHYPKDIKSFYMYWDDDGAFAPIGQRTVACADLLFPGIGEVMGGSQREHRLEVLEPIMKAKGLDYQWYLDIRKYGTVPHSGYGIGMDRVLRFITGATSIMDVVPFPVRYQHLHI